MDRVASKAVLAVSTAAALLAAQPAQAAMACWDQQPAAAARVRDLQSRLRVAALRCRAMGVDVLAAYNDFVRRNREALQTANGMIKAQFDSGYGKEGLTYYDQFATGLANRYGGDATDAGICSDTAAAAQEAASAAGDVGKLLALADRFGSSPDLPGGECPARAAKWRAAAPVTFAAVMDNALSDASDGPADPR
jgi:hypothetical protein